MRFRQTADGLEVDAPAKLNLFLEVGPLREDGFHPIESIFQAISLYDTLRFSARVDDRVRLRDDPLGVGEANLVYRAAIAVRDRLGSLPFGVDIDLEKGIPHGGGLGGGSSDAAATLLALNRMWSGGLSNDELCEIGATLGSDVPFFLHGGTAICRGRGEIVEPLFERFDEETFHYVIVCPGIEVSTADVYRELDRGRDDPTSLTPPSSTDSIVSVPDLEGLQRGEGFFNRLEAVACRLVEALRNVGPRMEEEPFRAVQMSGSGSTFFGLCASAEESSELAVSLRRRFLDAREHDVKVLEAASLPGWSR